MKVVLIYYGKEKIIEKLITALSSTIPAAGHELTVINAEKELGESNLLPYDFILVGCTVINMFKGDLPSELVNYIQRCTGLERKKSVAFVIPRLMGNEKTLKNMMKLLESKGSFIIDFREIRNIARESELLASRIK